MKFLCPLAEDGTPGSIRKRLGPKVGAKVGAIQIAGAEHVGRDHVQVDIHGELLDGRGRCDDPIMLRVAGVASRLILKCLAMRDRIKDKDPFDIVWLLSAFPGGPVAAAAHVRASPIAGETDLFEAVGWLRLKFTSVENEGPSAFARFTSGMRAPDQESDPEELMRLRSRGRRSTLVVTWPADQRWRCRARSWSHCRQIDACGACHQAPAVILAPVSTNRGCDCLRINCAKVHESTVSEGLAYWIVFIIPKIGRYIATMMPPTTTPRKRIITGSISASSPLTATSTSSS